MNFRHLLLSLAVLIFSLTSLSFGQQTGVVQGTVTDETGAVIPATTVEVVDASGKATAVQTNENGMYSVSGLKPGKYTVRVSVPGFTQLEQAVLVLQGATATADASLRVALEVQRIDVEGEATTQVSTDPTANAGAIVLRGDDLQTLSDDPDELAADLQALAGPAAGPNGGQIFIDGFSGAQLPRKESIREIRVNSNPFSAEFDRLGFGRIEIFTKPGTDRFHGQAMFGISDGIFNSRNPFATNKPDFRSTNYGFNIGGPLSKRSSFFVDAERRAVNDNSIIYATVLDPSFNITSLQQAVLTPSDRTSIAPRLDYAINANNTLVARYNFNQRSATNSGVGEFTLLSRGVNSDSTNHTLQLTETAVLSAKAINETRLQFIRSSSSRFGENTDPAVNVLGAFVGGGAQVGNTWSNDNRLEFHNVTSIAHGTHAVKFGTRVRRSSFEESTPRNFGGTFTFAGDPATGVSSIERYRMTVLGLQQGLSIAEIQARGGGPTQFTISGGNPLAGVKQWDGAIFVQDDWRLKPNLTLSLGLRYEMQTNIQDWGNFAPRIGLAWAPGSRGGRPGKTVVRGGFGMFYDRVESDLTLDAVRFNGVNQQNLIIQDPSFFDVIPAFSELNGRVGSRTRYVLDPNLRAPYMMQSAISIERQLPRNTTFSTTYTNTRALHLLRTVNASVLSASQGNLYQYESTGVLNQNQLMFNVNSRFNRNLTIFSYYALNKAMSDTDGVGTFPADPFDFRSEYGRAAMDIRHRFVMGGNLTAPFGVRFNPFVIASSGRPFNITIGRDLNGDTVFTDRPAFAAPGQPGARETAYGWFNPRPGVGDVIIPRNYADGPGSFTVNLRASRSFGFGGPRGDNNAPALAGGPGGAGGGMRGGGGGGGPRGGGGMRGGGGFGGGGMRGGGDNGGSENRYNLTLSIQARNVLNNVNLATPVGNLSSALFGQSTQTAGGFGPGGSDANNRRIEFQLRFNF